MEMDFEREQSIDYICVLDYLMNNWEIEYHDPKKNNLEQSEKQRMLELEHSAQIAVGELEKMAQLFQSQFGIKRCSETSWLDGSGTKTKRNLCIQMRWPGHEDNPVGIYIYVEKHKADSVRYRVSLDFKNDGVDGNSRVSFHSYLDKKIDFGSGLVLMARSDEWGCPYVLTDSQESVKEQVTRNKLRKVQLCKCIEKSGNNGFYQEELLRAVGLLLPYYNEVLDMGDEEYWPSKEEYDPGITVEQWVNLLQNPHVTTENNLKMFAMMLDFGRPAACSELAERYGGQSNFFNAGSSSLARRVYKNIKCKLPSFPDNENARWWPILYVGRMASKNEIGSYVWKLRDELKEALGLIKLPDIKEIKNMDSGIGLNTILYGPPGTGKTYSTVNFAVSICEPDFDMSDYNQVLEEFRKLKRSGRVAFTTFHQSYGYEEFIEGIRPCMIGENGGTDTIAYQIKDGVFKAFCESARNVTISAEGIAVEKTNPRIWCMMLDGTGNSELKSYCFKNGEIRIGWPSWPERITEETEISTGFTRSMLTYFQEDMEIGDLVVVQKSKDNIDAIGIIAGKYEFDKAPFGGKWPRKRKVKWIAMDIDEDIFDLNGGKHLGRLTVYPLDRINADDLVKLANSNRNDEEIMVEKEDKPYVFIIDEINRGNISKIFGELITLIETTKRKGATEAASVVLPYSGEEFSVPSNVYILGTMNTADRSIALLDTALRRRFDFIEIMPKPEVLHGVVVESDGERLNVEKLLQVMNRRIEYLYDREHTIGHAFFTKLKYKTPNVKDLEEIFKKSVIPLLQEYFYEDYEKIQLVLGDNDKSESRYKFIIDNNAEESSIFKGQPDLDEKEKVYSLNEEAFKYIKSYIEII